MEAVAVYSDADAGAAARPAGRRRRPARARRRRPRATCGSTLIVEAALATGAEADPSGLRLPGRAGGVRPGGRGRRARLRRAAAGGRSRRSATSSMRDGSPRSVGVDGVPGTLEPVAGRPSGPGGGDRRRGRADRLPAAGQGGGRRRRTGHAPGRVAPRTCRPRWPRDRPRRRRRSATARSTWSARSGPARHIEVQLLGDATGRVVAIGERDCSLQRRHQKLVEEAPAPGLSDGRAAPPPRPGGPGRRRRRAPERRDGRVPPRRRDGAFYFLEVNTRLQVEHGVTELVDRPRHRPRAVPAGRRASRCRRRRWPPPTGRPSRSATRSRSGCRPRIPARDFAPGAGPDRPLGHAGRPGRPGRHRRRRTATASRPTTTTWSPRSWSTPRTGDAAIDRLRRALDETEIAGIQTTLPFHRFVARHAGFRAGDLSIDWVAERWDGPADRARGMPRRRPRRGPGGRRAEDRSAAPEPGAAGGAGRPGRDRLGGRRPGRRGRSVARDEPPARHGPGDRRASWPRSTRAPRRPRTEPRPGDRPIVLAGDAPVADGPRPHRGRGRRRRLAVRARGRGRRPGRPPGPGDRPSRDGGRPPRPDRGSCHHPGTGRVGGGRRRAMPSRPASGSSRWRR